MTLSFSFIVSGEVSCNVALEKGLRQGYPIKGFSSIIQNAEKRPCINWLRIVRSAPPVSYLFFAYDSLVFGKALVRGCR